MKKDISITVLTDFEEKIIGVLRTLYDIEIIEGIDSPKFKSLCRLLNDFLIEEENLFESFVTNSECLEFLICLLREKTHCYSEELVPVFSYEYEQSILLKIYKRLLKLKGNSDPSIEFFDCKFNLSFLRTVKYQELKYKFAFMNSDLCLFLTSNYFDVSATSIYNSYLSEKLKEEEDKYLYKKFKSSTYIATKNFGSITRLYEDYLHHLESLMSDTTLLDAKVSLFSDPNLDGDILKLVLKGKKKSNNNADIKKYMNK